MFKHFAAIPIFRRLFLAFFLAVLIPDLIILSISIVYSHELILHGMSTSDMGSFTIGTILALLVSTGVVIALGYLVNSTITQPLSQLATLAKRIRQGETSARASIAGRDEIAIVASSINSMLDQIVKFIDEAQGQRDFLQGQVERLIRQVEVVGEGNLDIRVEVVHESLSALANSFNYMVGELSNLVIRVKQVTIEVESSTMATQQEMIYLVADADTQLQQISRTASTVEAMTQACLQVVERTQVLDQTAREARQAANQGRQTVQQTLEGIHSIHQNAMSTAAQIQMLGERSQQIDEIISFLENIAHQTNRLALDATIQVAVAGNAANTGFGAIADGIRRLSEETKEQLNTVSRNVKSVRTEILTVASSMQEFEKETTTGASRIQETGKSLSKIFGIVELQAGEIETINRMMAQLLGSSREISQIMSTVSDNTMHNSNRTRDIAQRMKYAVMFIKQLRKYVEAFRVKNVSMTDRSSTNKDMGSRRR